MDWLKDTVSEEPAAEKERWQILVVDDEPAVHQATTIALKRFEFDDRGLDLDSAMSAEEAREKLATGKHYALILLDVVMETENAGLDLARHIRSDLANSYSRIVLRTGQPGVAPEQSVIRDYDIDGYKSKSELQRKDLETVFYTSLRAYRDICQLQKNRHSLEQVIRSASLINEVEDLATFASVIVEQLSNVLDVSHAKLLIEAPQAVAISGLNERLHGLSAARSTITLFEEDDEDSLPPEERSLYQAAVERGGSFQTDTHYVYHRKSKRGHDSIFAFKAAQPLNSADQRLIELFLGHVVLSFENLLLNASVKQTQELAISLMGGAMESRSRETGAHVIRVGDYSRLLAELHGEDEYWCNKIRLASQLHDVGKVGIPDAILKKPGKLDAEEWEIMKGHASIGHRILAGTDNPIIEMAANIARDHHEKWDGTGYPNGATGGDISLEGRITTIVDVFDALCSRRCYKSAWTPEDARAEIERSTGSQFDPHLAGLFLANFDRFHQIYIDNPDEVIEE